MGRVSSVFLMRVVLEGEHYRLPRTFEAIYYTVPYVSVLCVYSIMSAGCSQPRVVVLVCHMKRETLGPELCSPFYSLQNYT